MSRSSDLHRRFTRALVAAGIVASGLAVSAPLGAVVDMAPPPASPLVDSVAVDAKSNTGVKSNVPLLQDHDYLLEASGQYFTGFGPADAECSTTATDPVLRRKRPNTYGEGLYDVMVDLTVVEWIPVVPDSEGCDGSGESRYQFVYHAPRSGQLALQIADTYFRDNNGSVKVDIYHIGEPPPQTESVDTVTVNSNSPFGASTDELEAGQHYLFRATGTFISDRREPRVHDAECTSLRGQPGVRDVTTQNTIDDYFDLYVDKAQVAWKPVAGSPLGCDDVNHAYEYFYTPKSSAPVNLKVVEPFVRDNIGSLTVQVYRITSERAAPAAPPTHVFDQVTVPGNKATATMTNVPLQAGTRYVLEATGNWFWGNGFADAECSTTLQDGAYLRDRFQALAPDTDLFDLLVNSQVLDWQAPVPNADGCSDTHVYRAEFTPAAAGQLALRVNDNSFAENWGGITVKVFLAPLSVPGRLS